MSFELYMNLRDKKITKSLLYETILHYFSLDMIEMKGKIHDYVLLHHELSDIEFYLINDEPPRNVWYSDILDERYYYDQHIMISVLNKENFIPEFVKYLINFFIVLNSRIEGEMLLTSDVYNDILYANKGIIKWSNSIPKEIIIESL